MLPCAPGVSQVLQVAAFSCPQTCFLVLHLTLRPTNQLCKLEAPVRPPPLPAHLHVLLTFFSTVHPTLFLSAATIQTTAPAILGDLHPHLGYPLKLQARDLPKTSIYLHYG